MTPHPNQPWTVERADRALPLLRRIAADLVRTYTEWRGLVERFELASSGATPARPAAELELLQRSIQRAAEEIEGFLRELEQLGVECKAMDRGLFDFPAERDGRPVYLCWLLGEPAVTHWHELDAGFGGRQPLHPEPADAAR